MFFFLGCNDKVPTLDDSFLQLFMQCRVYIVTTYI